MKTKFLKLIAFGFIAALFVFTACQDDDTNGSATEEEQILESVSVDENETDDVLQIAYIAEADVSSGGRVATTLCATVTHDEVNKQIIIDFGDGCVGPYGRTRSGKIIVTYSTELGDNIANRIITFDEYFVNNKQITGTIELRDVSINNDGKYQSTKKLVDLKITFPNGESITFNGSRTREWLEGYGDEDPANNVFRLTGSVTGVSTTGRSFTHEIVEPIVVDWSCAAAGNFARVAGVTEMTKLGGFVDRKRRVEYGDGDCDKSIRIITFRRSYTITID